MALSIATFNTFGVPIISPNVFSRYKKFCEILNQESIDVINFQEVHFYFLFNLLRKYLTNFPYFQYEKGIWGPRAGLVTFSKYPLEHLSFNSTQYLSLSLFSSIKRFITSKGIDKGFLTTRLKDKNTIIVNVYLAPNRSNDWSEKSKYYAVNLHELNSLKEHILKNYQAAWLIVAGDFNVAKDSKLYREFIENAHLIDTFADADGNTYHSEFLKSDQESHWIDYILVSVIFNNIESKRIIFDQKIDGAHLSDHMGLTVTLRI
jgi:exonuclease III